MMKNEKQKSQPIDLATLENVNFINSVLYFDNISHSSY